MNTLLSAPVAPLLERLFADAAVTARDLRARLGALTAAQKAALVSSRRDDYHGLYARAEDIHMSVSRATGDLLYLLARSMGARRIVEYGTSFGISTIFLAAALRDNGGGRVIGSEMLPRKVVAARANLAAAGLAELAEVREGDALVTLAADLPDSIDLVLLDGHKPLYRPILDLLAPRLRSGALVVADNADASPAYLAAMRAPGSGYLSTPVADDVELSLRL